MTTKTKTERDGRRMPRFELIAGNVCLDFINTLDDRPSVEPKELLTRYTDIVRFGQDSGLLDTGTANYLFEHSHVAPEEMQEALRKAIDLREAMHQVFSAIVNKSSVPAGALGILNGYIQEAAGQARLVQVNGRFEWRFDFLTSLGSLRWPIARAAADLLASPDLELVRACSSPACQWLFLDTSKNHHRRWCSMKQCGNREKVRRFYARRRA
jgi:predicted RNA-binding Zn ribbon-like protein